MNGTVPAVVILLGEETRLAIDSALHDVLRDIG
jgi:DNA-binding transcriptional ArsR family regulator